MMHASNLLTRLQMCEILNRFLAILVQLTSELFTSTVKFFHNINPCQAHYLCAGPTFEIQNVLGEIGWSTSRRKWSVGDGPFFAYIFLKKTVKTKCKNEKCFYILHE